MNFRDSAAYWVATGGYIGNIPFAPGTFGSLLGLPLCYLLSFIDVPLATCLIALLILVAIWAAHGTEKKLDKKDPGCIVVDEVAGMAVTLVALPFTMKTAVMGFLIFRLLDIVKPPPVCYLDKKIPGGAGVVLDDVAAGLMGNVLLRFVLYITGY